MDGGRTRGKKEGKVDGHAELNSFLKGCGASHGEDGERVGLSSMYGKHSILYRKLCTFYTGSMCILYREYVRFLYTGSSSNL